MLLTYLKLSLRNLMPNKTISMIHITGFGLDFAAFLFATQTVISEYSFDKFLKNRDQIYNIGIVSKFFQPGNEGRFISAVPALFHRIKAQLPDIYRPY